MVLLLCRIHTGESYLVLSSCSARGRHSASNVSPGGGQPSAALGTRSGGGDESIAAEGETHLTTHTSQRVEQVASRRNVNRDGAVASEVVRLDL